MHVLIDEANGKTKTSTSIGSLLAVVLHRQFSIKKNSWPHIWY